MDDDNKTLTVPYIVRDHLFDEHVSVNEDEEDEFLRQCNGVCTTSLINILSEHMQVVKVLHPKEYQAILNRINQLK